MLKETYNNLEPKEYSILEIKNTKGVFLNEIECYHITKDIVKLELENKKLKESNILSSFYDYLDSQGMPIPSWTIDEFLNK